MKLPDEWLFIIYGCTKFKKKILNDSKILWLCLRLRHKFYYKMKTSRSILIVWQNDMIIKYIENQLTLIS